MIRKIAISGKMVTGKTTLLNAITALNPQFVKVSLADPVKDVAQRYFKMPKEDKDRSLLQKIGQQFRSIRPTVWIDLLNAEAEVNADGGNSSICDDVRFPNEIESMKQNGWLTIRLEVNEEERLRRVKNTYGDNWQNHWDNRFEESETSLDGYDFEWDYVFTDMLYENIEVFAKELCELINGDS